MNIWADFMKEGTTIFWQKIYCFIQDIQIEVSPLSMLLFPLQKNLLVGKLTFIINFFSLSICLLLGIDHRCLLMYSVNVFGSSLQRCFEICFDLVEYLVYYLLWFYSNMCLLQYLFIIILLMSKLLVWLHPYTSMHQLNK